MTDMTIEKTIFLAATQDRVWDYLTKSADLAKWFHPAKEDLRAGGAYELTGKDGGALCWGEVHEMSPKTRLSYSFTARPMNGLMTTVTWTLAPVDGGTQLSLEHKGFADGAGLGLTMAFDKGWDDHLARMRSIDA